MIATAPDPTTRPEPDCLWWRRGVVYQVYPRSFQDTDGDGVGDLGGVIARLDDLQWLGVDAIWLSPFYPSPMKDFGYDVADHTDVDPLFGDLATFDRLLAAAHERQIGVIVDYVPNHTSDQHPWFRASRSGRNDPKRDWYFWRDAKQDGSPPNNWLSMFGGSAWAKDEATGQSYLHTFLPEQPDLNWRNPAVKEAMFDVARFWLDRGVDGFRIDVAHFILKDPALRDNPPEPEPEPAAVRHLGEWALQRHLHDLAHPDLHGVYREFRRLLDAYGTDRPRLSIGELYDRDLAVWAGYYGADLDELHLPFNFHLLGVDWDAQAVRAVVDAVEAVVPAGAWPNWVLGNHDRTRIASRVGDEQARLAMTLLLTLRGTPTLYYGDEIGMRDGLIPPARVRDPWETNMPGLGRDPQRTPMQWDAGPNAGFAPPAADPWLPIAPDHERVNVATQRGDPRSLLELTRRLLALRRQLPALAVGDYRPVDGVPAEVYAYQREAAGQRVLVLLNFAGHRVHLGELAAGPDSAARPMLSTDPDRSTVDLDLAGFELAPNEGLVLCLLDTGLGTPP